jgi:hypothetical protein
MTQYPWSGPFLVDVEDCLLSAGPLPMLDVLYSELVRPSLDFDCTNGDPLLYIGPILVTLSIGGERPLIEDMVSTYLPRSIEHPDSSSGPAEFHQLCAFVKASLLLFAQQGPVGERAGTADILVRDLISDMEDLTQRAQSGGSSRKRKHLDREENLGPSQFTALDVVSRVLGGDEDLRRRWPDLHMMEGN